MEIPGIIEEHAVRSRCAANSAKIRKIANTTAVIVIFAMEERFEETTR